MSLNKIDLKKVGFNIRKYREARQYKLEFVAKKAGISKSCMSRIENGKRDTSISNLISFAEILEVSPASLLE